MRRPLAAALLALLAGCGGAEVAAQVPGEPRALARVGHEPAFALAGEHALIARVRGRLLDVRALAVDGSGAPSDVYRFEAPRGDLPRVQIDASAERAAASIFTENDETTFASGFALFGPPRGPWEPAGPPRPPDPAEFHAGWHEVDGATVFTTEFRGDLRRHRVIVREPGAEPREVVLPQSTFTYAFAGDLVAYAIPVKGQPADDEPRRLVLRNWRTGEQLSAASVPEGIEALDVRADGRVVLNEDGGGLLELRDGRLHRLTRTGVAPAYAGDRIVFLRQAEREGDERLAVVEPDRRVRPFGVPTAEIEGFETDGRRVLWSANGCLLVADVAAPAASAPAAGPCPRSELFMDDLTTPRVGRSRRVPLTLRCIAAAPPGCRGTVRVELVDGGPRGRDSSAVRFTIPAGRASRLAPRLTRRAYRAARREARAKWSLGGAALQVRAVAVDPEGRRSHLRDGYAIEFLR